MANANRQALLTSFKQLSNFAARIGADKEAATFQTLHDRLQSEKLSAKDVEADAWHARAFIAMKIARLANTGQPQAAQISSEFSKLKESLSSALFPTKPGKPPETQVAGLAGNKESTTVVGDPAAAPEIAKQVLDTALQFSNAIFRGDFRAAYNLCSTELRARISLKRLTTDLAKSDNQFGGPAVRCVVERINWLYADQPSQLTPNSHTNWPKDMPKQNKRATVVAFWFTHPNENRGRWTALWVSQENGDYRIAKYNQFLQ